MGQPPRVVATRYRAGVLNPVGSLRHVAVGGSLVVGPLLVLAGLMGGGTHEERFDAKQVVVSPVGTDGVRVRETVDEDFGTYDRHGYERIIPNDFGAATDVGARSSTAPDQVSVADQGFQTRIRIGDPDTTIDGQHRYELSYTLPDAQLSTGQLALDIIGDPQNPEKFETGRFEVILTGFELANPTCNVGPAGTVGGCELTRDGDLYRVVFEPLRAGYAVTVGGQIVSLTKPIDVPLPAPIPTRHSNSLPLAGGVGLLGVAAGLGGYRIARRQGRNEVGGGGAADAAYSTSGGPTRLVTDKELDSMVTTEFVPPAGIRPWQGALLLNESVDSASVSAWFSDQIAVGVVELTNDSPQILTAGSALATAEPITRERITTLLGADGRLTLGKYQPELETLWSTVMVEQKQVAAASGWWNKFAPGTSPKFPAALGVVTALAAAVVGFCAWKGFLASWPIALLAGFAVPAVVAGMAYRPLLPQRSATGSALALRTESFRRFLEASEGQHVDWAWKNGLLREYSAWAVALGAAKAWGRAVASSAVPSTDRVLQTAPLFIYSHGGDWSAARTKPAPAAGSSGGGFSSGFSGGGGGGGSSGSW